MNTFRNIFVLSVDTMRLHILLSLAVLTSGNLSAQFKATGPEDTETSLQHRLEMRAFTPWLKLPSRNIGPVEQGGRIVDIDVDPRNHNHYYVAYASGGLFHTRNNGQSFSPLFDQQGTLHIGDIAIAPSNPDIIWLGTGENNSSRSSYAGSGIFRSTDGGVSWKHLGLTATQHTGRIIVHPADADKAWVAAIGPLYSRSAERGVFFTSDGGKSWKKQLYINDSTGVIELTADPSNPDRLWAAAWDRNRRAWEFNESGNGTAVYVTEDGGKNWKQSSAGLPSGAIAGRIGLAVSKSSPNVLYAVIDNQQTDSSQIKKPKAIGGFTFDSFKKISAQEFAALEDEKLDSFLRGKGFPDKYTAAAVKKDVAAGRYAPSAIADYFGDANQALFSQATKGAEVYRSNDSGKSWVKAGHPFLRGVFNSYGYYFGQIRIAPDNPDEIYIVGVPMLHSGDAGKTWTQIDTFDVHGDHHAIWINPTDSKHLLLGTDGGLYLTYDKGIHWTHLNDLPVGQFYTVNVDMMDPYNVYGGLQDNGVRMGSSQTIPGRGKGWKFIYGGDGMCVVADPVDTDIAYAGSQFGFYSRLEMDFLQEIFITPQKDLGEDDYRFNWRTPFVMSPHNHEILYMGSQYLMRSMDKGNHWEKISGDLTANRKPQGNVPYSTLTTISESPKKFGLIWAGTDDGNVQLTTDGGNTWKNCNAGLPKGLWVSSLTASPHDVNTAFLTLTGYRYDHFNCYAFRTTDSGKTWISVKNNLPEEPANILIQDRVNADVLYLGTDHGLYISTDGGKVWNSMPGVPCVAVYDMVVHPREADLVVGTHGRSVYIVDVSALQALKELKSGQTFKLLSASPVKFRYNEKWGEKYYPYLPADEPLLRLKLYSAVSEPVEVTIKSGEGDVLHTWSRITGYGYDELEWNLTTEPGKYLGKGKYSASVTRGSDTQVIEFEVK